MAHSWGAFVTINALSRLSFTIDRMIFLAPLTFVPPLESFQDELASFAAQQSNLGRKASLPSLVADFELIRTNFSAEVSTPTFSKWPNTLVVQGTDDDVTPSTLNRRYFEGRPESVEYIEVNDNHWLNGRTILTEHVLRFLRSAQ
ncbi:MAG: hypothetical protein EOP06_07675 [Proteobacteria bacterium]|nr:MAG: hypothetical protein EOP06_07675 [Pseudomonadota bacterium]